jgi:hypothetical protein
MLRYALAALAMITLLAATLVPDDAFARRGGGAGVRAGGFHGGGMRAANIRGGAVAGHGYRVAGRGYGVANRGYGYRPIPGHPIARTAVRRGVYRGAAYGAAVGAAAAGTYGYYNNYYNSGCYYDRYGSWVCPGYPYYRY